MIPDNLAKRSFKQLLSEANLPKIRFHDLRHTAATLMLSRGVHPKVVSEMLGHADISITLRVYAHVTPHMQQVAVNVMDQIFAEVPKPDDIGIDASVTEVVDVPVGVNVGVKSLKTTAQA